MKTLFVPLTLLLIAGLTYCSQAQTKSEDYIVKDTIFSQGHVTRLRGQHIYFQVSKNTKAVLFKATEIAEFGDGGHVFESVFVDGTRKFLPRLAAGKISLYKIDRNYGIKIDTTFTSIDKRNFRLTLRSILNCEAGEVVFNRIGYSKNALRNLIQDYNSGKCDFRKFPYNKFGGFAGYSLTMVKAIFHGSIDLKNAAKAPTLGFFYDVPLYRPRSFFLSTEVNWQLVNPLLYQEDMHQTKFANMKFHLMNFTLDGKMLLSNAKVRTYVKAGVLTSWVSMTASSRFVETTQTNSIVEIESHHLKKSNELLLGFNSAGGIEIPYKKHHNFHMELKYLKSSSGWIDSFQMSFSGFSLLAGYNF